MKLTIKQIAEMAGVSVTTVSQILNNKGSRFSEETRKRVLSRIFLLRILSTAIQKRSE